MTYLIGWMIADIVLSADIGARWLIFYTNQSYILLVLTFLMLAVLTLMYTIQKCTHRDVLCCSKAPGEYDAPPDVYDQDNISFFAKIAWFLWVTSINNTPAVVVGFYATVLETPESLTAASIQFHGVNLVIIVIDVFLSRIPLQLLHFPWAGVYSICFVVFTGIYFAAGGTDPDGRSFIYPTLDYEDSPGESVGWALLLGLNPFIVHFIWWVIVFVRDVLYKTCSCCYRDITEPSLTIV